MVPKAILLLADQLHDTHDRIDAITAKIKVEAQEDGGSSL